MPAPDLAYGIDIGGTKIELVACDAAHNVVHRKRIATPTEDYDALVDALCALVLEADAQLGARPPVGLGVPGIVDADSGKHLSVNVPALTGRVLMPVLAERLQRPLALGNDCQCFALSEAHGGAADGQPSMFGVILGTGAGAGYCVQGRLVRGLNGVAGEWGHWSVPAPLLAQYQLPLERCACGLSGCLERYVSGRGIGVLYRHVCGAASGEVDVAELAERLQRDDPVARHVFALHLDLLAAGLAAVIRGMDPHVIVLGGGLSKLTHLYAALPGAIAGHLFAGTRVPPILPPAFGDAGGARGAALLVRQTLSS